jgi:hypothetical protein
MSQPAAARPVLQWRPEWNVAANPGFQTFFRRLGRALRGVPFPSDARSPA